MKLKNIIAAIGLSAVMTSCGFLDVEPQVICSDTFYNTQEEALYGLAGVYGVMNNEAFYGNYYSLMCSNVDDLCYFNRSTTANYTNMYKHDASATEIYQAWTLIYKGISNANAFMEAIPATSFDKDGKLYNEARFLRAYYHFILAQAWGDVPMRKEAVTNHDQIMCGVSSQYEVLSWAAQEMEECIELAGQDLASAPSRINEYVIRGVLARVYLFMAGETVEGGDKSDFYKKAMDHAQVIISSGKFQLNPEYSQVFINMISDEYDREYNESMWEVDFLGHRASAETWSNGRIGDLMGLQSSGASGYSSFLCNFAYGQYDGSLKLWDLYWTEDRTADEASLPALTDKRHEWNMPPYNYAGRTVQSLGMAIPASTEKAPYVYDGKSAFDVPTTAQAVRNCGKWRREVQYEGVMDSKRLYTGINYPLLRYSDVLLMCAEATLEYTGAASQESYNYVKEVRDRAGIKTKDFADYDVESLRQFIRNERGRELCFEGIRKYDLIRWGVFVESMKGYIKDATDERWSKDVKASYAAEIGRAVQAKHIVLPVPSVELGVNTELVQNPLW